MRPNILFCLADDWGWPHAGAYGDRVVKTPTFDRLAEEGVLFERAYVSSPSCTPCRSSILTGQQFYRLDAAANLFSALDVTKPNFMFLLRDAGYKIAHHRKAWGPGDYLEGGYTEHPCGQNQSFDNFMKNRDQSEPFCFWLGTSDPHRGYVKGSGAESGIDINKIDLPKFFPDTKDVRSDIADYYFEVQRWDSDVAHAISLLEQSGELDHTIIVMTGDHGMPFPRCKGNLYDWGTHVPLAIRWGAKVKPNRKLTDFVSLTDLAPTFLAAAGVDVPKVMTGRSLLPTLKSEHAGQVESTRDFMVFGRERHTPAQEIPSIAGYPSRAIRTDQWLLILNFEPDRWPAGAPDESKIIKGYKDCDGGPTKSAILKMKDKTFYELCFAKRGKIELYDCSKDPEQINNLANSPEYLEITKKLEAQLVEYLVATEDPRVTDKPVKFDEYPYGRKEK